MMIYCWQLLMRSGSANQEDYWLVSYPHQQSCVFRAIFSRLDELHLSKYLFLCHPLALSPFCLASNNQFFRTILFITSPAKSSCHLQSVSDTSVFFLWIFFVLIFPPQTVGMCWTPFRDSQNFVRFLCSSVLSMLRFPGHEISWVTEWLIDWLSARFLSMG